MSKPFCVFLKVSSYPPTLLPLSELLPMGKWAQWWEPAARYSGDLDSNNQKEPVL